MFQDIPVTSIGLIVGALIVAQAAIELAKRAVSRRNDSRNPPAGCKFNPELSRELLNEIKNRQSEIVGKFDKLAEDIRDEGSKTRQMMRALHEDK